MYQIAVKLEAGMTKKQIAADLYVHPYVWADEWKGLKWRIRTKWLKTDMLKP